jgi:hypothetical protein
MYLAPWLIKVKRPSVSRDQIKFWEVSTRCLYFFSLSANACSTCFLYRVLINISPIILNRVIIYSGQFFSSITESKPKNPREMPQYTIGTTIRDFINCDRKNLLVIHFAFGSLAVLGI